MFKKVYRKLYKKVTLLRKGVLLENVFDTYYTNKPISTDLYHKPLMTYNEANEWLGNSILSGKPFFASRFGNAELGLVSNHLFNQILNRDLWSGISKSIVYRDPAWHGSIEAQKKFYDSFLKDITSLDGLGVWYNHGEQVMTNYLCQNAVLFELGAYEPFFHENPWTLALEGKRVLVVHPYTYSIPIQYAKRSEIFDFPVLPDFELLCYAPFSTYNDEWKNYEHAQSALDKMISDISAIDFDVALVACGPFGLPLSAAIKRMNKQAIHIGGALQLFFGIIGKRWENPGSPQLKFVNKHWKRPDVSEIPTDPRVLKFSDGGCYW